jgi:large subunit ribosomal protein L9
LAAKKAEEDLKETEQVAVKIDGQEFEMASKADDTGKLYGSITAVKVAKFLKDSGFDVKKNNIKLKEPIKELGEYDIMLELDHGLEATVKLIIVPEEDKA